LTGKPNSASAPRSSKANASEWVIAALQRLDILLQHAVTVFSPDLRGGTNGETPFPGLSIDLAEAQNLLARPSTAPFSSDGKRLALVDGVADFPPFRRLQRAFDLSQFDLWVIILALAPELDLRYEKLYGFLQDDITRRRPSVDLALNLLCSCAEEKLTRRTHFAPDARIFRHRLIRLSADPNTVAFLIMWRTSLLTIWHNGSKSGERNV
jgi:hypothetical protein